MRRASPARPVGEAAARYGRLLTQVQLGGLLVQRPYRFAEWIEGSVLRPADPAQLLPDSTAPAVRRLRTTAPAHPTGAAS